MKTEELKAKIREYPVVFFSGLVFFGAAALLYLNWDNEVILTEERNVLEAKLDEMKINERNAKNLAEHVARAKSVYEKVKSDAVDFESMIEGQSFFSDLIQKSNYVKIEALPSQQALPALSADAKPFGACSYLLKASGSYAGLMRLISEVSSNPIHSMTINRVQLMSPSDLGKPSAGVTEADISFQIWGKKGDFSGVSSNSDKKVSPPGDRSRRLELAEKLLMHIKIDTTGFRSPFNPTASTAIGANSSAPIEVALSQLKFSIITFNQKFAVKIDGIGIKREKTDFDLKADGKIYKLVISHIDENTFTVITPAGKKVSLTYKK